MVAERLQVPETNVEAKPQEFRPFTDQETRALITDGGVILSLTGETIEDEQKAERLFGNVTDAGDRLLKLPSIRTEVVIYPDPKKFFIPNSGNKNLQTQERLAEKDGQELRERLGLKDDSLTVIIPEQASTLTELTFRYLDKKNQEGKEVWLFGKDYGYFYGRTKNPVDESGSYVAFVGPGGPDGGVGIGNWDRVNGHDWICVVRLLVAIKK